MIYSYIQCKNDECYRLSEEKIKKQAKKAKQTLQLKNVTTYRNQFVHRTDGNQIST